MPRGHDHVGARDARSYFVAKVDGPEWRKTSCGPAAAKNGGNFSVLPSRQCARRHVTYIRAGARRRSRDAWLAEGRGGLRGSTRLEAGSR